MLSSAQSALPLGTFSRLPKELRILIWKELIPERRYTDIIRTSKQDLTILRTNHQLNTEIITEIYGSRVLIFRVTSSALLASSNLCQNQSSTIEVYDQLGSSWCLYPRFHKPVDQQARSSSVWEDLPFHKLKATRFEVEAPDPKDPAQLILLWNKLCWLMDLLQHVKFFSRIEVHALQSPLRSWLLEGDLQQSLINNLPSTMGYDTTDLEILLSPFLRLRHAEQIELKLPFDREHQMLDKLVRNIRHNAVSTIPFGQYENDDETDDEMIISDEDTWTVWFDHILDDLPGPSAPLVRLERFWNWSSHYERNMWCLIQGKCEMGGALLSESEQSQTLTALISRCRAKQAFNPVSFRHVQEEGDEWSWNMVDEWAPEGLVLSTGKDGWSPGKWWTYQEGIPQTSSVEYRRHMDKYGDEDATPILGVGDEWRLCRNW
jgi:hypothetical protein